MGLLYVVAMDYEGSAHSENSPRKIRAQEAINSYSPPSTDNTTVPPLRNKALSLSSASVPSEIYINKGDSTSSLLVDSSDKNDTRWASASRKFSGSVMEDVARAEKRQRLNSLRSDLQGHTFRDLPQVCCQCILVT